MDTATKTVTHTTEILLCAGVASEAGNPQADASTRSFALKNTTATAAVKLGPHGGATWPWDMTEDGTISIDLEPGEELYGIVAGSGDDQTVEVLEQGR